MRRPFLSRPNEIAQIARRRAWLIGKRVNSGGGVRYWRFINAYPGGLETTAYMHKALKGKSRDKFERPVSMFACYRDGPARTPAELRKAREMFESLLGKGLGPYLRA